MNRFRSNSQLLTKFLKRRIFADSLWQPTKAYEIAILHTSLLS